MTAVDRRQFMQLGGVGAGALGLAVPGARALTAQSIAINASRDDEVVRLSGDGLDLTPAQTARLLLRLADELPIAPDAYSIGGSVEQLEADFARALGKERAMFMPTGTLANHLAVRALAGGPSRVIVQEESHLYQDEGDCAQTLSNLTLLPLARGRATFTVDELQQAIDQTRTGRVASRVSAISIETPVRRRRGERFDPDELQKVVAFARGAGIRLHLDGARLFLQAVYTGEDVATTAKPFDTVYVSLYKYFNAPSGAILAGSRDLLDDMHHVRRMFGGGLNQVWPFAAVARHYVAGFGERYARAVRTSEELIRRLSANGRATIERVPSGTNLFELRVRGDAAAVRNRLAAGGVLLSPPQQDTFLVAVNETLNRMPAARLIEVFSQALG